MTGKKKRQVKLVPMYVEDIEKLFSIAESMGVPFRQLLSEIANKGGDLYLATKGDLETLQNLYKAVHNLGRLGFIILPVTIANKLLENGNSPEIYTEAEKLGKSIGTIYALNNYKGIDDIKGLLDLVFMDATQTMINKGNKDLKITVSTLGRKEELIQLSIKFLDAFLSELGYIKKKVEVSNGLIILIYEKTR